ncbi:prolyl-tRNA synthetase [Chryseobacterium koreense]|uniref:prolyl-tRNA synthetase n=1 Tax=Chryseobacterium koreense TaxID=232216 RepID=UPI0026F10449|nr:prolyl-tRNA synthetase [Chryseobacterium koreense]
MKKFTYKKLLGMLKSNWVLAISGALVLTSCTIQTGGYSETDGVYYDPNKDTLPEGIVMNSGNRVGEYYDYQANDDQNVYLNSENRNQKWQGSGNSDWGNFTGTETYYTDNWGYYPYGYNSGFGFGMSFGYGFGGYYNPWGFGYNPWYGYYNPWYGYYSPYYYGYSPYYGYYDPYYYAPYNYGYGYAVPYKRRGAEGMSIGGVHRNSMNQGVRNVDAPRFRNTNTNGGFRNNSGQFNNNPRINPVNPNNNPPPRMRNNYPNTVPNNNPTPRYQQPTRSNDGGGFRSGGDSGFRSGGSSGGFRSGSSNTSGTRSSGGGGFRR